jgi:hypothetical protein
LAAADAAVVGELKASKARPQATEDEPSDLTQYPSLPEREESRANTTPSLPPLVIPEASTDVLLERQIASCAGLIEHIAHYIARNDSAISVSSNFMERIASLMNSSATAAKMVSRYRGIKPAETCHRSIIERVDSRSGQ